MASRAGSSGNLSSSRETHATSRGVTLPAAGLRLTQSSRMVPGEDKWGPSVPPVPLGWAPRALPALTVQQRGRGSVQHARGALGDPLGHQRGAGAHRLGCHPAAGSAGPFQRPVVEDLHHGLFQCGVRAGGREGDGESPGTAPATRPPQQSPETPRIPLLLPQKCPGTGKAVPTPAQNQARRKRGFGWGAPAVPAPPPRLTPAGRGDRPASG